jgi:long-chain acyl-CoA synthetase
MPTDKTSKHGTAVNGFEPDAEANLADAVRARATADPDAPALIVGDASLPDQALSWRVLDGLVDACAAGLLALGLPAGARVAIALPNMVEFAVAYFGVLRAGLVAVPTNPGYTARELTHQLGDSGSSVLIGTPSVLATVEPSRPQLPELRHAYRVGGSGDATSFVELTLPAEPVQTQRGGEDLAVLLYTSANAGAPRGAMLSHRALVANGYQVAQVKPAIVESGDAVLLALPLFHAYGLGGLGTIASSGGCGVLVERFDPAQTLHLIAAHHVGVIGGVPQMYVAWSLLPDLGESLASVRVAVSGAAPLDPATAHRFLEATRHPIFEGYGLTETGPVVTTSLASPVPKTGSVGRPVPGVEVRLVAADGSTIVHTGPSISEPGEIVVRGANLFSGYWPDRFGGPDADGWWRTGDVAYVDADGDLFLVDRLDELILVSGFNVYPHEIELVLAAHPGVAEAAVVGVPHPYAGQSIKAYVVPTASVSITVEDLSAYCECNLVRYKCPAVIEFVAELPHGGSGKVRKGQIR